MARKPSVALTDAEARVMAVLWRTRTATVADVVGALEPAVSYSTVQTILRILETKGYVTHEKVARAFVYHPVVDERPASDPEARSEATALRHRLTAALETLPPKLRQVVVLRDIYDLPHEAIAAELGISETAAKVRLHRARKKLREDLFPRRAEEAADAV